MRIALFTTAALMVSILPVSAATVDDATAIRMAMPGTLIVSGDLDARQRAEMLRPVDAFYGFWINGSQALLDAALSPDFVDHTLPPGRPQGPTGPATASKAFLAAVPDLQVAVIQRLVVQDRVVSHMRFSGHFTGSFHGVKGKGQPVDFIATDILKVTNGKVTDNWHLEDNLTFLTQIGAVANH